MTPTADKEPGIPELRAAFERHMQSTGMYWDSDRDWDADGDEQYADSETRLNYDVWCAAHESGRAQARAELIAEMEPVAWINLRCVVRAGEFIGHMDPEVAFARDGDWEKSQPLAIIPKE